MRIFQWMKRAIQFVFDPEMYYLAWLAIKNQFKPQHSSSPTANPDKKKRAKAFNSH